MSCIRLSDYFANVVQANEIMQFHLQLFYNERCLHSTKLNITNNLMYSLKWNIFLNKVIAPGFARSNNLQTKYKLNTKFSFHSLNSANAYA